MNDKLFEDLEQLYRNLDAALPSFSGNVCGDCKACCTAEGLTRHHVGEMELANIAHHVGEEKAEAFRQYTGHHRDDSGAFLHAQCPFYNDATRGCGIYTFRPFSCRIFGHFRANNSTFPKGCVFHGKEQTFEPQEYTQKVPYARQLRELMRVYMAVADNAPVRYVSISSMASSTPTQDDLSLLDMDDPYDKAMLHQVRGEYPQALQCLAQAWQKEGDKPYLLSAIGLTFEFIGNHAEAISAFTRALQQEPDCAAFHYHIGYNSLSMGDSEQARVHLMRTIELNPRHALATGFLGYMALIAGNVEEGARYMEEATRLDPDNGYFHLRLGLAWLTLGRVEEGLEHVRVATRFDQTREQALQILKDTKYQPA
ncbi:MAG TPA: tetratricopeptide repeat protein [Candidatus Xenobia bacterium]|jgi:tetratricopeptide (TPR) repeat protein